MAMYQQFVAIYRSIYGLEQAFQNRGRLGFLLYLKTCGLATLI